MLEKENIQQDEMKFHNIMKNLSVPKNSKIKMTLNAVLLESPIGSLVAIGNNMHLYLLQSLNTPKSEQKIQRFVNVVQCQVVATATTNSGDYEKPKSIKILENELFDYFNKNLKEFETPIKLIGTDFQIGVWKQMRQIKFGKQITYGDLSKLINNDTKASRAVAQACGANNLLIIVPCHRVIGHDKKLGGFSCGIERKKMLLSLEGTKF